MKKNGLGLIAILAYLALGLITLYFSFKLFGASPMLAFDRLVLIVGLLIALLFIIFVEGTSLFSVLGYVLTIGIASLVVLYLLGLAGVIDKNSISSSLSQTRQNIAETISVSTGDKNETTKVTTNSNLSDTVVANDGDFINQQDSSDLSKYGVNFTQNAKNYVNLGNTTKFVDGNMNQTISQSAENVIVFGDEQINQGSKNLINVSDGTITQTIVENKSEAQKTTTTTKKIVAKPCPTNVCIPSGSNQVKFNDFSKPMQIDYNLGAIYYNTSNGNNYTIYKTNLGYIFIRPGGTTGNLLFPSLSDTQNYLKTNN